MRSSVHSGADARNQLTLWCYLTLEVDAWVRDFRDKSDEGLAFCENPFTCFTNSNPSMNYPRKILHRSTPIALQCCVVERERTKQLLSRCTRTRNTGVLGGVPSKLNHYSSNYY
jgi:hypothetical protein